MTPEGDLLLRGAQGHGAAAVLIIAGLKAIALRHGQRRIQRLAAALAKGRFLTLRHLRDARHGDQLFHVLKQRIEMLVDPFFQLGTNFLIHFAFPHPFTAPIMTPFSKYLVRKGYTHIMGSVEITMVQYFTSSLAKLIS